MEALIFGLDFREQRIRLTWRRLNHFIRHSIKNQSIRFVLLFVTIVLCVAVICTNRNHSSNEHNTLIPTSRLKFYDGQYEHNRIIAKRLNLLDDDHPAHWSTQINGLHDCTLGIKICQSSLTLPSDSLD